MSQTLSDQSLKDAPVARGRGKPPLTALGTEQRALLPHPPMLPVPLSSITLPGATSTDPGGSGLSHEEEEGLREIVCFWQGAPTVESPLTRTIWISGEPHAFGPLAKKWKGEGSVNLGLGLRKE